MQHHPNETHPHQASIDGLERTRYTLAVCVVCGREHIETADEETSCPECGAGARRAFAFFRDLHEEQ